MNLVRSGEAQVRTNLHEAIRQACAAAKVDPSQVKRVCLGTTGAGRPQAAELLRRILAEVLPAESKVVGDTVIALHAAFDNGIGIVVIAGTGSIAYGRNHEGDTARAGGWGYAISDEGSGQWIGRTAVSAALRSYDEGEGSRIFEVAWKAWGIEGIDDLVRVANAVP